MNDSIPTDNLNVSHTVAGHKPIKDSGQREDFQTGSRRDTRDGKGRFDLIPSSLLISMAKHLEDGSAKYGDRNWEKGQPLSRYLDSAMRHLTKYWAGYVDEMHLHAAIWNLMAMLDTQERIQDGELPANLDDHPFKKDAPLLLRVFRHVAFSENLEDCWKWTGTDNGNGYGVITVSRAKKGYPHRIVCEQAHGPAPFPKAVVKHSCDNPNCVNPRHLSWGTYAENNTESKAKGRTHSALSPEALKFIQQNILMSPLELSKLFSISVEYVRNIQQYSYMNPTLTQPEKSHDLPQTLPDVNSGSTQPARTTAYIHPDGVLTRDNFVGDVGLRTGR